MSVRSRYRLSRPDNSVGGLTQLRSRTLFISTSPMTLSVGWLTRSIQSGTNMFGYVTSCLARSMTRIIGMTRSCGFLPVFRRGLFIKKRKLVSSQLTLEWDLLSSVSYLGCHVTWVKGSFRMFTRLAQQSKSCRVECVVILSPTGTSQMSSANDTPDPRIKHTRWWHILSKDVELVHYQRPRFVQIGKPFVASINTCPNAFAVRVLSAESCALPPMTRTVGG